MASDGDMEQTDYWTGPNADAATLDSTCPGTPNVYPHIFQACGNDTGLHIVDGHSRWSWQGGDATLNIDMEVYLR